MRIVSPWKIIHYIYKVYVEKDQFYVSHRKWVKDKAEKTLRLNYDLNENSLVFDLGGYQGRWSNDIYNKYKCNIVIFEPVSMFYENIKERFQNMKKIQVFNFGLSNKDKNEKIFLRKDASTISTEIPKAGKLHYEWIKLVDIVSFLQEKKIEKIDLMKINIEGGEYDLLNRLIDSGRVKICKNLQIQFHQYFKNYEIMRDEIRKKLTQTHHITYDYPWSWENWEIN